MTIAITALTRKTAIVELFRQCHADRVGAPLLLSVLMEGWTENGLRGDDLSTGLNEMLEDGSLSLDADPQNASVALTKEGQAWLGGLDAQLRQEQEQILRTVRQRAENRPSDKLAPGQEPRWRMVDRRLHLE
jgi:hypothetical protein